MPGRVGTELRHGPHDVGVGALVASGFMPPWVASGPRCLTMLANSSRIRLWGTVDGVL